MREVVVLGIGQTTFGKTPEYTAIQLGVKAAKAAIKDAGIDPRELQVCYGSRVYDATQTIEDIMKNLGVTEREMHNCENACASGGTAFNLLYKDIANGVYDIGIVVGCESMTTCSKAGQLVGAAPGDLNGTMGITMPANHALTAHRMMATRGITLEDIAYPSVKNHRHGILNPYAQYRKVLTTEQVLNARMISDPITTLMCCPVSDGAAAAILCTKEYARKHTTRFIKVAASKVLTASYLPWDLDTVTRPTLTKLAYMAYEAAGIGPEGLDLIELHDAFSPEELYTYEALGLCKVGECLSFIRSGNAEIGGKHPVNPSGGLLSLGHPLGASGVRVVCEVTQHLRGEAGERQVQGAKTGMAEMVGGYLTGLGSPAVGSITILSA
ncbi:MAG: thiolase family protein [Peptococcaceae bacterium]|jgi:benzoylsuccinyl-CoA thiolase BbsB subunit|nr:thiolase family protein [Peptococcaceae bacterium]MDH7524156.1 thiolase family protein [Peptococcaceae bacterium]